MTTRTVNERLTLLENALAKLDGGQSTIRPGVIGRTSPEFLDRMVGIHANSRVFDTVIQEIEAERERQTVHSAGDPLENSLGAEE